MAHTIDQRELAVGRAVILVKRVFDDDPCFDFLGAWSDYKEPQTKDQKLVARHADAVLDHKGYWRNAKGQIVAKPDDERFSREYAYTFHDNGHECIKYALQDHKRMEDYEKGYWHFMGIVAEVIINGREIGKASLWGIESDSDESYIRETEREQVSEAIADARKFLEGLKAS